ncbi:unnamed protein product [Diplocarpon coronariae]|uniref:Chromo domain-containing protein n=1 Tax=Diplocarpon coronariae TaxID=2795749 RepID=A0A218ZAA6_9HELO|nr:hypothetical protein B2J93_4468 [Marssonina coronariae]
MPAQFENLPYEIREETSTVARDTAQSPQVVEICFKRGEGVTKPTPQVANSSSTSPTKHNAGSAKTAERPRTGKKEKLKTYRYPHLPSYKASPRRKCARAIPSQPTSITIQPRPSSREISSETIPSKSPEYLETTSRSPYRAKRPQELATPAPLRDHFADWADLEGIDWEPLLEVSSPPEKFTVPPVFEPCDELPSSPSRPSFIDLQKFFHINAVENEAWDLNNTLDTASRGLGHISKQGQKDGDVKLLLQEQSQTDLSNRFEGDGSKQRSKRAPKVAKPDKSLGRKRSKRAPKVAKLNKGHSKKRSKRARSPDTADPDGERTVQELEPEAGEDPQSHGVPAEFMAQRVGIGGRQLLVKWKSYPEEKDWTWELESELLESFPDLVGAWKKRKREGEDETGAPLEYVVEKILGKRKRKGLPHYLVKWEGYADAKDRTWEPCDRLAVDVPEIVAAYESKKSKK